MPRKAGYAEGSEKLAGPFREFPELWGRWLCLDYVNSLMGDHVRAGQMYDHLPHPGWQASFTRLWGLRLDEPSESPPLAAMVTVRTIVRKSLERWSRGVAPDDTDLRELDTILALTPLTRRLVQSEGHCSLEFAPPARNWTWVLSEVIASMAYLMTEGEPARLRRCANPNCTWLYYDETHARSRRWCSPRACGNLVKVRRFRERVASRATPKTQH